MKNYIELPDRIAQRNPKKSSYPLDINRATLQELAKISGIGNRIASRIVSFRNSLGGFISKDQYKEIYEISPLVLKNLKISTTIKAGCKPEMISINSATQEELALHPYISKKLAEDIVRFREINNKIDSETVLANFKSVDKSNFKKLILYLDFQ